MELSFIIFLLGFFLGLLVLRRRPERQIIYIPYDEPQQQTTGCGPLALTLFFIILAVLLFTLRG